jgi:hypothetical protein
MDVWLDKDKLLQEPPQVKTAREHIAVLDDVMHVIQRHAFQLYQVHADNASTEDLKHQGNARTKTSKNSKAAKYRNTHFSRMLSKYSRKPPSIHNSYRHLQQQIDNLSSSTSASVTPSTSSSMSSTANGVKAEIDASIPTFIKFSHDRVQTIMFVRVYSALKRACLQLDYYSSITHDYYNMKLKQQMAHDDMVNKQRIEDERNAQLDRDVQKTRERMQTRGVSLHLNQIYGGGNSQKDMMLVSDKRKRDFPSTAAGDPFIKFDEFALDSIFGKESKTDKNSKNQQNDAGSSSADGNLTLALGQYGDDADRFDVSRARAGSADSTHSLLTAFDQTMWDILDTQLAFGAGNFQSQSQPQLEMQSNVNTHDNAMRYQSGFSNMQSTGPSNENVNSTMNPSVAYQAKHHDILDKQSPNSPTHTQYRGISSKDVAFRLGNKTSAAAQGNAQDNKVLVSLFGGKKRYLFINVQLIFYILRLSITCNLHWFQT